MDSNTVTTCLKVLSSEMSNENISEDNKKALQDALSYVMKMYPACNVAEELSKLNVSKPKKAKKKKLELKEPKGMKDFGPDEMAVREEVTSIIKNVFKRHGAATIQTPVCEQKEILTNKYGEDSKLIFELKDQGGELLALRYDLTVPFARYLAQNGVKELKRYQIAHVYRRDQPYMTRGRYREFIQCDFDIAGNYYDMFADAECIKVIYEVLTGLEFEEFDIKVNDRRILDGMFAVCGCPSDKFRSICSAVDKLDKMEWCKVKEEMMEKGLGEEAADKIGEFVMKRGGMELIDELLKNEELCMNKDAKKGLDDMKILFEKIKRFNISDKVSFDLSLARGLDYYTGVIYEAVVTSQSPIKDKQGNSVGVGSVCGGGRYDGLVKSLTGKGNDVRCVGLTIGIERLFAIIMARKKLNNKYIRSCPVDVYVASAQKGMHEEREILCNLLWEAGIGAVQNNKKNAPISSQYTTCETNEIPYMVIIGSQEIEEGTVTLRNVKTKEESKIERSKLVEKLNEVLKA